MEISAKEGAACLRVLVAIAKADGNVSREERDALEAALDLLPDPEELRPFLDERTDIDRSLADITSTHAREQLWQAAYAMVHCDGVATSGEQQLLDKVRAAFEIDEKRVSTTKRMIEETKDTLLPSNIKPIDDPQVRQKEIDQDVLKYSALSALLGAFPVPGVAIATDLAIVALQVKLVRDIGQYWGHKVDRTAAKTLLAGLGLGTGARIAVSNLAKLVPVWGSAFGATTAFATTWALGAVANRYFEHGRKVDVRELKGELKALQKQGRDVYAQEKATVEQKRRDASFRLIELNDLRKTGAITQTEYESRVAELVN
jgi:uncharacterized protein (DUF697 family)